MAKVKPAAIPQMDEYEAGEDVRAMQRSREVQSDPKRHARAKKHAKKMLAEHSKKGAALAAVAQSGASKKASAKFTKPTYADLNYGG